MAIQLKRVRPVREHVIQFRATTEQYEFLKAQAQNRSLKVADMIREALDDFLSKPAPAADQGKPAPAAKGKARGKGRG